jgi:ribosomal protein L11 methyltransferase
MTETAPKRRWLELVVNCDFDAVEIVATLFGEIGVNEGVVIEEPFTQNQDDGSVEIDRSRPVIVSTFLDFGVPEEMIDDIRLSLSRLSELHTISPLVIRQIGVPKRDDQDWADAWIAFSSMRHVGHRMVVKAPWYAYEPAPGETVFNLRTGMAFGTGGHASTHLAMMALEDTVTPGARVLDVGTGTGILAIAAALLGASAVDAVDIEPVAIRVARENVASNGLSDVVTLALGSVGPGEPFQGEYDLVVANILADVLVALAPSLAHAVRGGGTLILSGIIDTKEAFVREAFEALGMSLMRSDELEGWVRMVMGKPGHRISADEPAGAREQATLELGT